MGLYYFGARYYDPRTSVWQSADPILGKYLPTGNKEQDARLPGSDVYKPTNFGLFTYSYQSPIILADPDGNRHILLVRFPWQWISLAQVLIITLWISSHH